MIVALPVVEAGGRRLVNPHFGKSNLFAVIDVETGEVETLKNPALHLKRGRGRLIAQALKERGVGAVLVKEIGPGAFERLREAGIEPYLVPREVKEVAEAVELFKEGKLKRLTEPNEG